MKFIYNALPSRVIFGAGRRFEVKAELERLGIQRALVLSTADQSAIGAEFASLFGDRVGAVYPGAVMHTPIEVTESAMHQMKQMKCDGMDDRVQNGRSMASMICSQSLPNGAVMAAPNCRVGNNK